MIANRKHIKILIAYSNWLSSGMLESPTVSHKETLRIAEIMQSIRKAVDVVYPQDII